MRFRLRGLLPFLAFFLITISSYSQINLGAYLGLNTSTFTGDKPKNIAYSFGTGYVVGLTAEFKIAEDVFLEVMPTYALGRSTILETDSLDEETIYEYPVRNTAFQMPTIVKIYAKPKLHFDTGLVPSYLISSSAKIRGEEIDFIPDFNRWYIGMLFGIGYRLEIGKSSIGFNLHYIQGLNPISDEPIDGNYIPRIRITNTRLTAVYHFKIKDNE